MTKQQALFYCKEKAEYEGCVTYTMLLDLYKDDEEVPDCVLDFICYPPQPSQGFYIYVGSEGLKMFNRAFEEYGQYLTHQEIIGEFKREPKS